jgi:putative beta-lysine N-acetyltransferase
MESDIIENMGNSIVQHGKYNSRIYLMKLSKEDFPGIIDKLDKMALENGYSKIFAKVPSYAVNKFIARGYMSEASIPLPRGRQESEQDRIVFMGKYFNKSRTFDKSFQYIIDILDSIISKENISGKNSIKYDLPKGFRCEICTESNISQVANLYKEAFVSYPFPITDPEYIKKTMSENFVYFGIMKDDNIVALSSCEMDTDMMYVEMTDFATLSEYRGKGFATYLLHDMEKEMRKRDMILAYTISRAVSYGINMVFAKMGYRYGGTLRNNTNISVVKTDPDNFESMNVWYKFL